MQIKLPAIGQIQILQPPAGHHQIVERLAGAFRKGRITCINVRYDADALVSGECLEGQQHADGLRTVVAHLEVSGESVHNIVHRGQPLHVVFVTFARVVLPDLVLIPSRLVGHRVVGHTPIWIVKIVWFYYQILV